MRPITNYVYSQAGFVLRGAPCTLGIFAAISSQYRWRQKKNFGPPAKHGAPGSERFGKSSRGYCITFIKRLDTCLRLQFLRQNFWFLSGYTHKLVGKILNWVGLGQIRGGEWKLLLALSSSFSITMFAMMGDNGEPIGVPNICWYMVCWKVKDVELKQISNVSINSGTLSVIRSSKWESLLSLSNTICLVRPSGMVVNRLTTLVFANRLY